MALKSLDELNLEFMMETELIRSVNLNDQEAMAESEIIGRPGLFEQPPLDDAALPEARPNAETGSQKAKPSFEKWKRIPVLFADVVFYVAILAILFSALTSGVNDGKPKSIFGYSYFTVLTGSMQSEIPQGSFILTCKTDPKKLVVGDVITFMVDKGVSVTHKITDIYENQEEGGNRAFQTKGVNNVNPDKDPVHEENIVGKVILSVPAMGAVIAYLNTNVFLVFIMFGLCVILSFSLRGLFDRKGGAAHA